MRKSLIVPISSVVFAGMLMSPANADDTDGMSAEQIANLQKVQSEPLFTDARNGREAVGVGFLTRFFNGPGNQTSQIVSTYHTEGIATKVCSGYTDYSCFGSNKSSNFPVGLADASISIPPCQLDSGSSCIESLSIKKLNQKVSGNLIRVVDNSLSADFKSSRENSDRQVTWAPETWPALPSKGLPAPAPPSIWQVPGMGHKGGAETYLVSANLKLTFYGDGSIYFRDMQASVVPFSEITGAGFNPPANYQAQYLKSDFGANSYRHESVWPTKLLSSSNSPLLKNSIACAYEEMNKCGLAYQFDDDTTVELKMRLPKSFGGWFHGQMADAELKTEPSGAILNRVTISGKPVKIPVVSAQFETFAPGNEKYRDYVFAPNPQVLTQSRKRDDARLGGVGFGDYGPENDWMNAFQILKPLMGDKAKGQVQMWSVSTMKTWETANPCFADKTRVQGILTTNSIVYQAGLPTFSKGQLSYQVAGLHYNHDGTEFTGEYTLQMRADDARCLYGYSEAPIQTKVSVTDSGGTQKIATTSVSERGGWLTIRARNFTFSSPKIVVSITQGKKSKAASTASVSVGKGKSLSAKSLMTKAKIKAKKGDKLDISVVGAMTTGVTDSGKSLKFKSKGTYNAKVTVVRKNGTSTSRVFKVVVK
jgi:hypothetical protein